MNIKKINEKFVNEDTGEIIEPKFSHYTIPYDYKQAKIKPIEPMTAKEEDREEKLEEMLDSQDYIVEEKLDGTRATLHMYGDHNRIFSRRISAKTDWYVENTDLLPHMRELECPELKGTILDGEMYIPNRPFKDISSTLNCKWDKAIRRQLELGFIHLKAFDILYYKGINIKQMPLWKRKQYLHLAIKELNSPYIEEIQYSDSLMEVKVTPQLIKVLKDEDTREKYSKLVTEIEECKDQSNVDIVFSGMTLMLSKRAYYEYIVALGGEGTIIKDKMGKYYHKRGREYTKIKKFDTWDCIVMGFSEPTILYTGKDTENWTYWYHSESDCTWEGINTYSSIDEELSIPVTKHFYNNWIGAIKYGVIITEEELEEWKKKNKKEKPIVETIEGQLVLYVGETSGMTEEEREKFSSNKESYIGKVIEVKAQEVIKKTGKLRHPRYLRLRPDKSLSQCTWEDHTRK